ncbi:MAG: NAD-dependent epimerase/dehydratase family protein [Nitrospirales bacterium]|nr:NAD(P)-dependent oxidoreductase [Nitrospirales bacterium]
MPLSVALTGASGFIGGVLAARLRENGYQVRALLRSKTHQPDLEAIGVEVIHGTLGHLKNVKNLVHSCDVVIHCAGAIRGRRQEDFYEANVAAIAHLSQACRTLRPPPKFILISSLAAREPSLSTYAWSKREGELTLIREAGDLSWVIFRPPAVYGPKDQSLRPLFQLMQWGIGIQLSPQISRFSLIHVEDFAGAIMAWITKGKPSGHLFEVDDGFPGGYTWDEVFNSSQQPVRFRVSIPQLALRMAALFNEKSSALLGYPPLLTKGKVAELQHTNWVCDTRETFQLLDWHPQISLKTGLRQLLTSDSL